MTGWDAIWFHTTHSHNNATPGAIPMVTAMSSYRSPVVPRAGWTLLGTLALVAILIAWGMLTVFVPAQRVGGPVAGPLPIVTGAGVARLTGEDVTVTATGASVFIAVARRDDIQAWLADTPVTEVAGVAGEAELQLRDPGAERGGDAALPDPARSDIWLDSAVAAGTAELVVPRPPADWAILVVGADEATLIWQRPARHPGGWPLLAGAVLLFGVAARGLARRNAALRARRRRSLRAVQPAGLRRA